jgi:hypothetical protein
MKQNLIRTTISCLFILFSAAVNAAGETAGPGPAPVQLYCTNIEKACTAAGFKKFGHRADNGLWKMCMEPLLNGKTVDKVTVAPEDIKGCQQLRAKKSH